MTDLKLQSDKEICSCHHHHDDKQQQALIDKPTDEELAKVADLFKMFADNTRVRILQVLMHGELCVCDIAELLNMEQSAISHQLRNLKQCQLIKNRRDGKTIYYSLADDHILSILNIGIEHIREQ